MATTTDPMDNPAMAFQSWDYWLKYPLAAIDVAVNLVVALLLFIVFFIVVWILSRILRTVLVNPAWKIKADVVNVIVIGLKFFLWMQLIPIVLSQIGIPMDSFISVITAVTFSIGISLRLAVENFVSGVILLCLTPFRVGDVVHLAGGDITGTVLKTSMSFTEVREPDGCHVFVPNACAYQKPIINHTEEGRCRVDVKLPLPSRTSAQGLVKARRVMLAAIAQEKVVMPEPQPVMVVQSVSEMHVIIMARVWVQPSDFYTAEHELLEVVRQAFVLNDIEMTVSVLASHEGDLPLFDKPNAPAASSRVLDILRGSATFSQL